MPEKTDSNKRVPYVDIAKGIGILLVVAGHNAAFGQGSPAAKFIYSFHMPLFFFLAGLFHNDAKSIVSHVALKAKTLLFPCILAFSVWVLVQAVTVPETLFPSLANISFNMLYGTGKTMFWGQLWFLTSLFVTSCSCHLWIRSNALSHNSIRIITAIILVPTGTWFLSAVSAMPQLTSFWINNRHYFAILEGLPWNIDLLPITAAFYLLGTTFPKHRIGNQETKPSLYFLAAAGAFAVVGAGSLFMNWGIDLNHRQYDHWAGSTLVAIFGIGGVLLVSLALAKLTHLKLSKVISLFGKRSIFILVLHFSLQQNSFAKMDSAGIPLTAAAIISFAIGLGAPLATAFIWEKARRKKLLKSKRTS